MVILNNKTLLLHNFTGKYISSDNTFYFYKNKMWHRYYGPVHIYNNGYKSWYFNHEFYGDSYYILFKYSIEGYSQKQFIKDLNKLWLL